MVAALCVSGVVGGLARRPGAARSSASTATPLAPGEAARVVLVAWLCVLAPTLAFAAVGLLGSVVLGRSPMGLLVPALLALAMNLVLLLPVPVAVRLSLPSNAFLAWRGLFTEPAQTGPLLVGIAVSLVWAVVATGLACLLFVRRDVTDSAYDGVGRRTLATATLPLAALVCGHRPRRGRRNAVAGVGHRPARGRGLRGDRLRPPLPAADRAAAPAFGVPRPRCTPAQPATRAGAGAPTRGPATTGGASCPGGCPARPPWAPRPTSST